MKQKMETTHESASLKTSFLNKKKQRKMKDVKDKRKRRKRERSVINS